MVRFFDRKVRLRAAMRAYRSKFERYAPSHPACMQGFYSVHGEDALFIARQFYKTTADVKYLGKQDSGLPGTSSSENAGTNKCSGIALVCCMVLLSLQIIQASV